MAHDFGIRNKTKQGNWSFFFGYAGGIMYKAFGEEKHATLFSGDNGTETKSKAETKKALDFAIEMFDHLKYPDPERMDDIKQFRKDMEKDGEKDEYEIWYS